MPEARVLAQEAPDKDCKLCGGEGMNIDAEGHIDFCTCWKAVEIPEPPAFHWSDLFDAGDW